MGGELYRAVKAVLLNRVYEGRAGISHFTRVVRAAFLASFMRDAGVEQLELPVAEDPEKVGGGGPEPMMVARPPFVVCMDEIIKKKVKRQTTATSPHIRGNQVNIG